MKDLASFFHAKVSYFHCENVIPVLNGAEFITVFGLGAYSYSLHFICYAGTFISFANQKQLRNLREIVFLFFGHNKWA